MPQFGTQDDGDPYLGRRSYSQIWPFSASAFTGTIVASATARSFVVKGVFIDVLVTTTLSSTTAYTTLYIANSSTTESLIPLIALPTGAAAGTRYTSRIEIPDGITIKKGDSLAFQRVPTPSAGAVQVTGYVWGDQMEGEYVDPPVAEPLSGSRFNARRFHNRSWQLSGQLYNTANPTRAMTPAPTASTCKIRVKGYSVSAVVPVALELTTAGDFGLMNYTDGTMVLPLLAIPPTAYTLPTTSYYQFHANLGEGVVLPAGKSLGLGFNAAVTSGSIYALPAAWGSEES